MSDVARHPIRVVARRTGTPETTLRAWERRYSAVNPVRAETGRRLYTDEDIQRLQLIRRAVDAGRAVSTVAAMSDAELKEIVSGDRGLILGSFVAQGEAEAVVSACLQAIQKMDPTGLRSQLNRAILKYPALMLIDEVIAPLLHEIGDFWYENRFSPRHEHMASSVVRTILTQLQAGIQHTGPETVVTATPPGHLHDLGTQFISALALAEGWTVVNLGASITGGDIAMTADEVDASVVALSIVYPFDDPEARDAISYLGEHLGDNVRLVVGGRAAPGHRKTVAEAGGVVMETAAEFMAFIS